MPRYFKPYLSLISLLIFVIPISTNYSLRELNFGNAGGGTGNSTSYKVEGAIGELGSPMNGTTYSGGLGFGFTQMAQVPPAPTFTNPANYYNKLHLVVNPSTNPSDTLFAIAISTDNFTTTNYVKSDTTVGSSLTLTDYQSYATWGGGSGFDVIGLTAATTYYVKVKAFQGQFTESGFGPVASAATVNASMTFDIDVAPTDTETASPYTTDLGTLLAGTVTTSSDKIWVDIDTNATNGGSVYVAGQYGGLNSSRTSTLLAAVTGDLSSLGLGFGLQGSSVAQTSGGPLALVSPYNGASNNVGTETNLYSLFFSAATAITDGRGSLVLKAKPGTTTPSSPDYTETLTLIAAGNF